MKVKTITTATNLTHPGFLQFKRSLEKYGWDYDIISDNYVAFGSKMKNAYEYAKKTDCTHLWILDSYDIVVLGSEEEALGKISDKDCVLFNAEKACWPHGEWEKFYPPVRSDWKYLNGGACFVNVERFIKLFEENPIKDTDNDQEKLGWIYITNRDKYKMQLDDYCRIFQSVAFEHDNDFEYTVDGRLYNKKTKSFPVIAHGNGKTDMSKVYKLL